MTATANPVPVRMQGLPVDERGYVVPWFVAWVEGKPEFRAMDPDKFVRAIKQRLCWVCGQKLGVYVCFVAGPMCGINRTSAEPPSHVECARWSAMNCPFLSNPRMVRREDELTLCARENVAGVMLSRNPGVAMLWTTRVYDVWRPEKTGGYLIQMGEPESVEWYVCGRLATRSEVMESVNSGLPNLEAVARQEKGGLAALLAATNRFMKFVPKEVKCHGI